jgi:hypothetical protein
MCSEFVLSKNIRKNHRAILESLKVEGNEIKINKKKK